MEWVLRGAGGRKNGELSFSAGRVSVLQDKESWKMSFTTVQIDLTILNYTFNNGSDGKLYALCI